MNEEEKQSDNLDNYHLLNDPNLATNEEVRDIVRESGLVSLLDLVGLIETVTTVPTHVPGKFEQQFKIYVDSISAPTVKRLYFYSNQTNTWINLVSMTVPVTETDGGTGESTYTKGDILYSDTANSLAKLAGNTTTTRKFLTQTGTGSESAAPGWNTIASSDLGTNGDNTKVLYGNMTWQTLLAEPYWQILGPTDDDSTYLSITSEYNNGDVIFTAVPPADAGGDIILSRYEKSNGLFYRTHTVTDSNISLAASHLAIGMAVVGSYLYVFATGGGTKCYRYSNADLTGTTAMTWDFNPSGFGSGKMPLFTDGTYLYFGKSSIATDVYRKYSVSGTSFTLISDITFSGLSDNNSISWCDGTYVYFCHCSSYDGIIYKYDLNGTSQSTTTMHMGTRLQSQLMRGFYYVSSTTFAIAIHGKYDGTNYHTHLLSIDKP